MLEARQIAIDRLCDQCASKHHSMCPEMLAAGLVWLICSIFVDRLCNEFSGVDRMRGLEQHWNRELIIYKFIIIQIA